MSDEIKHDPELVARLTFDPARMPERDAEGYADHPDLCLLYREPLESEEHSQYMTDDGMIFDLDLLAAAGFVWKTVRLEDDDAGLFEAYFDFEGDGLAVAGWHPTPPAEGAELVSVYDTEDGPAAIFLLRDAFKERAP